jgi:hypothetical protein
MVERLRSNGLSTFAENVSWPEQTETPADLRNLVGYKGLREGDRGARGGKTRAVDREGGTHAGTRIGGFLDSVVDCTDVVRVALENVLFGAILRWLEAVPGPAG